MDNDDKLLARSQKLLDLMRENKRLKARLTQIEGQAAVADSGNWRDVIDNIKHITEGRFETSENCDGGKDDGNS